MPAARRMHCIDKARTPTMRCVRRGTPAAQSSVHRPLRDEGPDAASRFPLRVVGSVFWRDAQAGVPSAEWPRAQLAFKDSMVRGILQFTPGIAFRYVLHRCESRDIRCRESLLVIRLECSIPRTPRPGQGTGEFISSSLARPAPGFCLNALEGEETGKEHASPRP